jgi:Ca2+-binding EF-hand superfamily protein
MAALTDEQIKEAFNLFDADGSCAIDIEEMLLAMKGLGFGDKSREEVVKMHKSINVNDSGLIEFKEFERILKLKMAQKDSMEEIEQAFQLFDLEKRGRISLANLKEVARLVGDAGGDALEAILREVDEDRDEEISLDEFKHAMLQMRGK